MSRTAICTQPDCGETGVPKAVPDLLPVTSDDPIICGGCGHPCEVSGA